MTIKCVWEHNGNDSMLYSVDYVGAFTRGENKEIATSKMQKEIEAYLRWKGEKFSEDIEVSIQQEWVSSLDICDADTDVIFDEEKTPLSIHEYLKVKELVLKSASDVIILYDLIPDKHISVIPVKNTFLGPRPRTAFEMYEHTKEVNSYYFGEICVPVDNEGTIYDCRKRGFDILEAKEDFLKNKVYVGNFNEEWSLKKVMRRFIWHDRIHMKAMYRMAVKTFGNGIVPDVFRFDS